jgi:DNA-binding CsgD family transcriptional regulator
MIIPADNIIFHCNDEMNGYCQPLFDKTPVTYFEFVRLYPSGHVIKLDTQSGVLSYILGNDLYLKPTEITSFERYMLMSNLMSESIANIKSDTLSHYQREFNIDHFFFINEQQKDYSESCVFGSDNSSSIAFYMNNIDMLEKFCLYFKSKAINLIDRAFKQRLLLPEWRDFLSQQIASKQEQDSLDSSLNLTSLTFVIDGERIALTERESECLKPYLKGQSSKVIANQLKISARTVETHIDHIKTKLNCKSKSDLYDFMTNMKLDKWIFA